MSTRLELTREYAGRYRRAKQKKEKTQILTEFLAATGYRQRKYAVKLLRHFDTAKLACINGRTVKLKSAGTKRAGNRTGKSIYGDDTIKALKKIWAFYWWKCGKYLAPMIRESIDLLAESTEPDFHITPEIKAQLVAISPAQIDRRLRAEKDALRGKGLGGTRLGDRALMRQIPIRVSYTNEERITPGFCQIDTVHHCGWADSGIFCLTLTVTDVASGWTFLFPLRNKAHQWVINWLQFMLDNSPFPIAEMHTDNGSEFINKDTVNLAKTAWAMVNVLLTRSRAHHSNDNCFAEQKNNAFVRNYVGLARYDTDREYQALGHVYAYLCPLLNFFVPNKKLLSKKTEGSKTVKTYDKELKTPYQRLMESSISQEQKDRLAATKALYNPVQLQQNIHRAVNALIAAHKAKGL